MRRASLLSLVLLLACAACEPKGPRECAVGLTMCCPNGEAECEDVNDTDIYYPTEGCVDITSNSFHCGGCAMQCPSDPLNVVSFLPTECVASVCEPTVGACVSLDTYPNCELACAVTGQTCLPQGCDGHTMYLFSSQFPDLIDCNPDTGVPTSLAIACDASPPPEYFGVGSSVTCCCD